MLSDVRGAAGIERRGHVLALLTRLKQVCNHPVHALGRPGPLAGRSGKLDRLDEMLAEAVDEGDSSLVFTQYAVMGRLLADHLNRTLGIERLLPRRLDADPRAREGRRPLPGSTTARRACWCCRCGPAASAST